jgi:hypothetical protein
MSYPVSAASDKPLVPSPDPTPPPPPKATVTATVLSSLNLPPGVTPGMQLQETWEPVPEPLDVGPGPEAKSLRPKAKEELPMMQSDSSMSELMARKVVVDAAREALVLLVSGLDGDGASRALLQIERVSKCFRAATAHLGQPVYPEELGRQRRGSGMFPTAYGGGFQDRETMGVTAFQQLLSFAGQHATAQIPRQIDALLSAAETARRGGMTDLADTLEGKARAMTASLDTEPEKQAAAIAAATSDIAIMANAAEGAFNGYGSSLGPIGGGASGGLDELADMGFPQAADTISEMLEEDDDDLFSSGPQVQLGSIDESGGLQ